MKNISKCSAKITCDIKFDIAFYTTIYDDKHIFDRCCREIWDPVEDGSFSTWAPIRRIYRNNNIQLK
jgi:hypothetical protein